MPTGLTEDAGWQIGVSRTVHATPQEAWDLLTSPTGLATWLGAGVVVGDPGDAWDADDGSHGQVRSRHPGERLRLTCQRSGDDHETTVQVVLVPAPGDRVSIRFHQERLLDGAERERQRTHWRAVLDDLEVALARG